jgi:hypothetical protein
MSPTTGPTTATSPGLQRQLLALRHPDADSLNDVVTSAPRSMPITPQAQWSWIGVCWPRAPDEAHDAEAVVRVGVEQVLPVALRVGSG